MGRSDCFFFALPGPCRSLFMTDLLLLLAGIVLLAGGGEVLIRGALAAAQRVGLSPLLSGLLIVGMGTSAPELAVSVDAALSGQAALAVGNVVGSNISNVLLILGTCALIAPIAVPPTSLSRDAWAMIGATVLATGLAAGAVLTRLDALALLVALGAYLVWAYRSERAVHAASAAVYDATPAPHSWPWTLAAIAGGLLLLVGGSQVLLRGAVGVAQTLGLSETVIGLTLVAVGTSLPELSVSIIAALRNQADVAVGNVLGSNIFNLLGILGLSAAVHPLALPARVLAVDLWVMGGTALALLLFLYTGRRLTRLEGALLFGGYATYVALSVGA